MYHRCSIEVYSVDTYRVGAEQVSQVQCLEQHLERISTKGGAEGWDQDETLEARAVREGWMAALQQASVSVSTTLRPPASPRLPSSPPRLSVLKVPRAGGAPPRGGRHEQTPTPMRLRYVLGCCLCPEVEEQ